MERSTRLSVLASGLALALLVAAGAASGVARASLVASGIPNPVFAAAPDGDARLFVVDRAGRIRIVQNGALLPTPFLDIAARVGPLQGTEGGLLGLAFPADYATSGTFTVYYTDLNLDSVVSRFTVTADPNIANPNTEQVLLFIDQPNGLSNHKGGTIHYGPDGFLWFATGDGGGSNDPSENAQNPQSLLGKMLRLDVGPTFAPDSLVVAGQSYRIPADNPFVGSAPRDEIWALGFRNPFRWSFDRATGDLWIGDVGQDAVEEVDFEPATDPGGRNYGWDVMEGSACNGVDPAPAPPCDDASLTLPVYEYDSTADNCSITGGNVYRADFSPLHGLYFFGDFCTGRIWSLNPETGVATERTAELGAAADVNFTLVAFGEDGFGRLLIVHRAGNVYRVRHVSPGGGCGLGPELALLVPLLAGTRRLAGRSASASL